MDGRRAGRGGGAARPIPIDGADAVRVRVRPNGGVPNHPSLDALILPGALANETPDRTGIARIGALFEANRWLGVWHWTVHPYHHFHPTARRGDGGAAGDRSAARRGRAGR